jgi:hypothetical protein
MKTNVTSVKVVSLRDVAESCRHQDEALRGEIDAGAQVWGNWKYNADHPPSIDHQLHRYEIVLAEIQSTEQLGDWLLQLGGKQWITTEDLGNLVRALQDLEPVGYHHTSR